MTGQFKTPVVMVVIGIARNLVWGTNRAQSEMVYDGMVYRHFFGRLEIIPPLLSGRLPYRYAVGLSIAVKCTVHSAVHENWSVNCQENH